MRNYEFLFMGVDYLDENRGLYLEMLRIIDYPAGDAA